MVIRRLRFRSEVDESRFQALVHDLSESRLFLFGEHSTGGEFLVDAHPGRTSPTAVVTTAMDVAQQWAALDIEDALPLVSAHCCE